MLHPSYGTNEFRVQIAKAYSEAEWCIKIHYSNANHTKKKKNYTENNKYIWENSNDLNIQEMTDKFHNKDKFNYSEQYKDIEME